MRKRPNLASRMEKCPGLLTGCPEEYKGRWLESLPGCRRLHLELGCGKGRFTAETASADAQILYLALEKVADVLILAMERVRDAGIANVRFINGDAAKLGEMFDEGEVERIYINFCDPWPKSRDAKFRLTSPGFLRVYADILAPGGQIHFKTDNVPLFDWSVEQLRAEGWELSELCTDLHGNGPVGVMTDYEARFYADGVKINRLVATRCNATRGTSAGAVPRIHNAALRDARGYERSISDNSPAEEDA